MKYIVGAALITETGVLTGKAIGFKEQIEEIVDESRVPADAVVISAKGKYVLPGLINIHIHGCMGKDVSDGTHESMSAIGRHLLATGVTSYCPTLLTVDEERYQEVCRVTAEHKGTPGEAQIIGLHLEGIYLSHAKKGAHKEEWLRDPDADKVLQHKDSIVMSICAPELPGAADYIKRVSEAGIVVALGHSNATYEQAKAGFAAGATDTTHLFNAMSGHLHRNPGLAEAALQDPDVYTELICDGFHVDPVYFDLVWRLKKEKLVLITDSISMAGCPDGEGYSGPLHVTKHGVQCLCDDGTVAGSVIDFIDGLKTVAASNYLPLHELVNCATRNPARLLKIDDRKGTLAVGKDADLLIVDGKLNLEQVYQAGQRVR